VVVCFLGRGAMASRLDGYRKPRLRQHASRILRSGHVGCGRVPRDSDLSGLALPMGSARWRAFSQLTNEANALQCVAMILKQNARRGTLIVSSIPPLKK